MRDQLLAYLLDDLDPADRGRIEERLRTDPIWQQEMERLQPCLEAGDGFPEGTSSLPASRIPAVTIPKDLASRTCSFVKHAVDHPPGPSQDSPRLATVLTDSRDRASRTSRWSLADIVVAAGVLAVMGMLLIPALRESRESARRLKCQENLRSLGTALVEHAHRFGGDLPHIQRDENTGSFVLELADRGLVSRERLAELLVCPSTQLADDVFDGIVIMRVPTRQELAASDAELLKEITKRMAGSYAYRVGYVDNQGKYHQVRFVGTGGQPLLSDAPSSSVPGFQSPNHGGCGQNVVSQDLSNRYHRQCMQSGSNDHFFLNEDEEHAAGRHPQDIVLGLSELKPHVKMAHDP